MQCPRCGILVFADCASCRHCGWPLSKPYLRAASTRLGIVGVESQTPSGAEFSPNGQQRLWATVAPKSGSRRRRQPRTHGVAELPQEAYFAAPPRAIECLEMPVFQPSFDFAGAEVETEVFAVHRLAPLGQRLRAGLFDAGLILFATTVFFSLFALLGGQLGLVRRDFLIYILATFALASIYFCLFTYLGGHTPGMQHYRLEVTRFDGEPLGRTEARARALGYIVSIGSFLLGFLWALADEDKLTWHDRISRTFLSPRHEQHGKVPPQVTGQVTWPSA